MAIMISIPAGIVASQEAAQRLTESYNTAISKATTLIECSASPRQGMFSNVPSGTPFGMPSFGSEQETFINETIGDEIRTIEGVKDVVPFLQKSSEETTSETLRRNGTTSLKIGRAHV